MMHLEPRSLNIVQQILSEQVPECDVWAYGSRVHGKNLKPFSDLDLVIKSGHPLPPARLGFLGEAFSGSDLPFKVDVTEWITMNDAFRKKVEECYFVLQEKK